MLVEFFKFLAAAPLQLRASIRVVIVDGGLHYKKQIGGVVEPYPRFTRVEFKEILEYLPQLESLTVKNIAVANRKPTYDKRGNMVMHTAPDSRPSSPTIGSVASDRATAPTSIGSRSLKHLEFCCTCTDQGSPADYVAMLASLKAVETLRIVRSIWSPWGDTHPWYPRTADEERESDPTSILALGVRRLDLSFNGYASAWLELISRTRTVLGSQGDDSCSPGVRSHEGPTLKEIAFTLHSESDAQPFGRFLKTFGKTLEQVEVGFGSDFRLRAPGAHPVLLSSLNADRCAEEITPTALQILAVPSSCPQLRGLTISFATYMCKSPEDNDDRDLSDAVLQLLPSLSSEHLKPVGDVTLRVYSRRGGSDILTVSALDDLARLLTRIAPCLLPRRIASSSADPSRSADPPISKLNVVLEMPPNDGRPTDVRLGKDLRSRMMSHMDANLRRAEVDGGLGRCLREGRIEVRWVVSESKLDEYN